MSRPPSGAASAGPPERHGIRVEGVLDGRWSGWLDGMVVSSDESGQTAIVGPVTDQAALHGRLAKVRDLALPLLPVQRMDPDR